MNRAERRRHEKHRHDDHDGDVLIGEVKSLLGALRMATATALHDGTLPPAVSDDDLVEYVLGMMPAEDHPLPPGAGSGGTTTLADRALANYRVLRGWSDGSLRELVGAVEELGLREGIADAMRAVPSLATPEAEAEGSRLAVLCLWRSARDVMAASADRDATVDVAEVMSVIEDAEAAGRRA